MVGKVTNSPFGDQIKGHVESPGDGDKDMDANSCFLLLKISSMAREKTSLT